MKKERGIEMVLIGKENIWWLEEPVWKD